MSALQERHAKAERNGSAPTILSAPVFVRACQTARSMIPNGRSTRLLAALLLSGLPTLLVSARLTAEQSAARKPRAAPARAASSVHVGEATIADLQRALPEGA